MNLVTETEAAERIGVARQTMRNWRMGYKAGGVVYAPRLSSETWRKMGNVVFYDEAWVQQMEANKEQLEALLGGPVKPVNKD